jgi:starch synthase (maltosyl-transferring)
VKHLGETSIGGLAAKRFVIEDIFPAVDGGRFPVKRIAGEAIDVWADIFRDGHEVIAAALRWRRDGTRKWERAPMRSHTNDRWTASFTPPQPGLYTYAIEAWTDQFATWRRAFLLKREAGQAGTLEALEGAALLSAATPPNADLEDVIARRRDEFVRTGEADALLSDDLAAAMAESESRYDLTQSPPLRLIVDPPIARAGAWYEFTPRSQGSVPGQHGTFDDCIARVPDIAAMGFDVLYMTPIHPIGVI